MQVVRAFRHDMMFFCMPPASGEAINHRHCIKDALQHVLLPAAALVPFQQRLSEELWHLMHLFTHEARKSLYGHFQVRAHVFCS